MSAVCSNSMHIYKGCQFDHGEYVPVDLCSPAQHYVLGVPLCWGGVPPCWGPSVLGTLQVASVGTCPSASPSHVLWYLCIMILCFVFSPTNGQLGCL